MHARWLPSLTQITYSSKLIGIRSVAAFLQLEVFRVEALSALIIAKRRADLAAGLGNRLICELSAFVPRVKCYSPPIGKILISVACQHAFFRSSASNFYLFHH
ncbi:MAG TPA: hypothetical protein DGZ94_06425 [Serratia sp.]|nr:hypothetical protein [Serratia sp. (in: enterobacteria)]